MDLKGIWNRVRNRVASPTGYHREVRVFLVTDREMQKKILGIMGRQAESVEVLARRVNTSGFQDAFRAFIEDHRGNSPADALNALVGWTATPKMLEDKRSGNGIRISSQESGVEVVFHKKQMYLTVPSAAHIEKEHKNCDDVLAQVRAWQPPAGLERQDPGLLGLNPVGFPRGTPSTNFVNKQARNMGLS